MKKVALQELSRAKKLQLYNNFKDQPVRFGSLVQLEHLWTHKLLTIKPQQSADVESENIKLTLKTSAVGPRTSASSPATSFRKKATVQCGWAMIFSCSRAFQNWCGQRTSTAVLAASTWCRCLALKCKEIWK